MQGVSERLMGVQGVVVAPGGRGASAACGRRHRSTPRPFYSGAEVLPCLLVLNRSEVVEGFISLSFEFLFYS